jgi:uncharacterized protein YlxW (UPF0749 family)
LPIHLHGGRPWWRSGWAAFVPLVAITAGLLFATSAQTSQGTDLRSSGRSDMIDVVRAQNRVVRLRAATVQQLQAEVDALTARAVPGNDAVSRLGARATSLAPIVGSQAVTGPGLSVTLDDAKRTAASLPPAYTADDIVVHQQDVQSVVNALWAGGAEAMMLQDQRVISTSAVRCVGNTLLLNGRVYSPPFTIAAIGPVAGMRIALNQSVGLQQYRKDADAYGLGYQVNEHDKVEVPAYDAPIGLSYAVAGK